METKAPLYVLMAEFDNPTNLVEAARQTYDEGYRRINGYSPFPIEELAEAIGFHKTRLPVIVLLGGIFGGLAGYFMMYYMEVIDYPLNVGGRPFIAGLRFCRFTLRRTVF